jgi:SAM-dependent methyltransferase
MDDDGRSMELFFELFTGLPRQGPGEPASTRRALGLIPALAASDRILDIGSGTGAQAIDLARACPASILGVDIHPPFVDELNASAARLGLADRLRAVVGDMNHLELPRHHFDVLWSEGAIFIIGFDAGLRAWRPLLRPNGHIAVSELCWLRSDPVPECAEWLSAEYPAIRSIAANRQAINDAGYDLVGDFVLPASAWWQDYYEPLLKNIEVFKARHPNEPAANAIAEHCEREVAMFRRYSDQYGYAFFVMRNVGDQS